MKVVDLIDLLDNCDHNQDVCVVLPDGEYEIFTIERLINEHSPNGIVTLELGHDIAD